MRLRLVEGGQQWLPAKAALLALQGLFPWHACCRYKPRLSFPKIGNKIDIISVKKLDHPIIDQPCMECKNFCSSSSVAHYYFLGPIAFYVFRP